MLVQERKLARASFPPHWNDVVQDAYMFMQEVNLASASFPPWWDDVVREELVLV